MFQNTVWSHVIYYIIPENEMHFLKPKLFVAYKTYEMIPYDEE